MKRYQARVASPPCGGLEELAEETGIKIPESTMRRAGVLYTGPNNLHVITLFATELTRRPKLKVGDEFSGMQWFAEDNLPNEMPADCQLWLPHLLGGKVVARYLT